MAGTAFPDIAELVPHKGEMCLLDEVVGCGEDWIEARVTIREHSLFFEDGAVGAWVGLEYMVQAVAAHAGMRARSRGEAVRMGLIVGTRAYASNVSRFAIHRQLRVRAEQRYEAANGVASFDCNIRSDEGAELAEATILVVVPADQATLLHGSDP
jgi:predicted hotdog family 3-hydroxylacyl-ACP dehydratase